jgi:site-specific DNA recombinase
MKEAAPRRVAIYTRKSTSAGLEQDFNSLDAQRESCAAYAKSQGWTVVGTYDDGGFTGANIERPAFKRLLTDVEGGGIDVIVVYKVDRLSRSLLDFAEVLKRLAAADVAFVSVTQNFSTADSMGRLTLNMLMSFAQYEREMIADRTRDKIAASRRRGKWTGGKPPIGYYSVDKKLVKSAPEATVVQEVFDLYERRRSVLEVMKELRARGRKMRTREWTKDGVLRVLKSPLYAALIASAGELFAAEHEGIVPREQFERVQAMMNGPRLAGAGRNPDYLLRGLLRCGVCGAAMTPGGSRGYRYYRCVKRDKEGASACASKPLAAGAIETYVVERLSAAAADPHRADALVVRMKEWLATERKALVVERARLPGKIAKLAAEAHPLLDAVGVLSGRAQKLAHERLEAVATAQDAAEAELNAVERRIAAVDLAEAEAVWVAETLRDFAAVWELMTPDNRQRTVSALVERVTVDETRNNIQVEIVCLREAA